MSARLLAILLAMASISTSRGAFVNAWFNEFHYANDGEDVGEFLEVAVPSDFTDLSNLSVTFYNGDGSTYSAAGGAMQGLDTFSVGASINGFTLYSKQVSAIQNGAPDGFSLSHEGTLLQFLSYEGVITATAGIANGNSSIDIGVEESDGASTPAGYSLGLQGTGNQYGDFTWVVFSDDTPGALNLGQTITAVPEPEQWGLISAIGLLAVAGLHSWRSRREPALSFAAKRNGGQTGSQTGRENVL